MCQIEEFNKYISRQVEDDENQEYPEEQGEEENLEEEEESANNEIQMKIVQKSKQIINTSNQLNTENKKYKTYSMDYKKELNSTKQEKEVASIYGINPKSLHRWRTKGLKKNQGKSNAFCNNI